MIHQIRIFPDPILLQKAEPVTREEIGSEWLKGLVADMWETCAAAHGLGLAANQIGVSKQLAVLRDRDTGMEYVLINPELKVAGENYEISKDEGCLSLPTLTFNVPRHTYVTLAYTDMRGWRIEGRRVGGFMAVELQHEVDHLQGLTLMRGLGGAGRSMAMAKLKKWRSTHASYP